MQIFFGFDLEVGLFSSRGEIQVRLQTLKANQTFKETTLETTKGSFQEPTHGTTTSRSSVTKCLCRSSLDWTLKLVHFRREVKSAFGSDVWRPIKPSRRRPWRRPRAVSKSQPKVLWHPGLQLRSVYANLLWIWPWSWSIFVDRPIKTPCSQQPLGSLGLHSLKSFLW